MIDGLNLPHGTTACQVFLSRGERCGVDCQPAGEGTPTEEGKTEDRKEWVGVATVDPLRGKWVSCYCGVTVGNLASGSTGAILGGYRHPQFP